MEKEYAGSQLSELVNPDDMDLPDALDYLSQIGSWPSLPAGKCIHYELAAVAKGNLRRRRVWRLSGRLVQEALSSATDLSLANRLGKPEQAISKRALLYCLSAGCADFDLKIVCDVAPSGGERCQWIFMNRDAAHHVTFNAPSPDHLRRALGAKSTQKKLDKVARRPRRTARPANAPRFVRSGAKRL